jgi:N-acetylmuramoyl-L-alanine amidase
MPPGCHEARTKKHIWGRQELPPSGRKFAGIIVAAAALVILPIEVSDAGWLSDMFKGSSKQGSSKSDKSATHASSPKRSSPARSAAASRPRPEKHADSKPAASKPSDSKPSASQPVATMCDPAKFRLVLDVGHTAASEGATSARNVAEFDFNLRLARRIEEKVKAEGYPETKLLVTEGKARPSLVRRVDAANALHANLFLSIHHDSVPNKLLEDWEFEGKKSHFSDRFSGYSVWVSRDNPDFKTSLSFAEMVAKEMKAQGLQYAHQYTQAIMGKYQHPLLNKETGVYSYDQLVVLRKTRMPAVLLEAGSIINRDEELKMDSSERRDIVSGAVAAAVKEFCEPFLGPP